MFRLHLTYRRPQSFGGPRPASGGAGGAPRSHKLAGGAPRCPGCLDPWRAILPAVVVAVVAVMVVVVVVTVVVVKRAHQRFFAPLLPVGFCLKTRILATLSINQETLNIVCVAKTCKFFFLCLAHSCHDMFGTVCCCCERCRERVGMPPLNHPTGAVLPGDA